MIACGIWTWMGFWVAGAVAGVILIGMVRTPAHLAVVDVRELSQASHPPKGPEPDSDDS